MVKNMEKLDFLTEEQFIQLEILEKYDRQCAITDFSILLGGAVSSSYHTSEGNSLKDRTGWWWTKTSLLDYACVVCSDGNSDGYDVGTREIGARPVLPYSAISENSMNVVRGLNGIFEVEYGEYPQYVVSEDFSRTLESAYLNRTINQTDKKYTTDSVHPHDFDTSFQAREHIEYEYNGKKYIRFVGDSNCEGCVLSDGRKIQEGGVYWVEVEPIKWMIDEKNNIVLSKKIIFAGVQFDVQEYYTGDFENTTICIFLNEIFAKDIIPSVIDKTVEQMLEEKEQLLQELKVIQEGQQKLLVRETELVARIEHIQTEIKDKGQYGK